MPKRGHVWQYLLTTAAAISALIRKHPSCSKLLCYVHVDAIPNSRIPYYCTDVPNSISRMHQPGSRKNFLNIAASVSIFWTKVLICIYTFLCSYWLILCWGAVMLNGVLIFNSLKKRSGYITYVLVRVICWATSLTNTSR